MTTSADLETLHQEILAGTPDASLRAYQAIQQSLPRILSKLIGAHYGLSAEDCGDLSVDAFMTYLRAPNKFDPSRAALLTYLVTIARSAAFRRNAKKLRHDQLFVDAVELDPEPVYNEQQPLPRNDPMNAALVDEDRKQAQLLRAQLDLSEVEERVLTMMMNGERATEAFAEAMGISGESILEQRRLVKRCKDKIDKRLERLGANPDA